MSFYCLGMKLKRSIILFIHKKPFRIEHILLVNEGNKLYFNKIS